MPEAFPIQAAYTNAHFPWAIAVALWLAHTLYTVAVVETSRWPRLDYTTLGLASATLMLVSMAPFILLPIGLGYAAVLLILWRRYGVLPRREIAWANLVLIFGIPLAAYNGWAISPANPVFAGWMQANLTPSPPIWDYLIAFGPLLILAAIGVWGSRRVLEIKDVFLVVWIISSLILLYAPVGLQRRFSMGLNVPLAIFAGVGLWRVILPALGPRWRIAALGLVLGVTSITTILAIAIPLVGVRNPSEEHYFISRSEGQALDWLESHAESEVVLASPQLSLFLPTRGLRVVYGHPFETLNAASREQAVEEFYTGRKCGVVGTEGVHFVVVGTSERILSGPGSMCSPGSQKVFTSSDGELTIYAASGN